VPLDPAAAHDALAALGRRLGMGVQEIAWAIAEVATANMYARFTPFLTSRGVNAEEYAVVAYGGAGPTHVCLLAQELGLSRVLIPRIPGALCALGCLVADLRADFVRVLDARCAGLAPAALEASFQTLETEARGWLEREGLAVTAHRFERSADMRYVGQSFELTAPLPERIDESLDPVLEAFYRVYHDVYGYVDREAPVEIVDLRMQIVGVTPKPVSLAAPPAVDARTAAAPGARSVYWNGSMVDAAVHQRAALRAGDRLAGPALIEQDDTTTVVPVGFNAVVDGQLNVIVEAQAR
jgi:N-methylhydantoinase A